MSRRRYPVNRLQPGELEPEIVEHLLYGWGRDKTQDPEDGDPFLVFTWTEDEFCQAWQTHREALTDEWKRRGERGRPYAAKYYGGKKATT